MKKLFKNSRVLLVLGLLLISSISLAKTHISGSINIWFESSNQSSNNKSKRYVGNIDDRSFEERAFVINNTGYSLLRDYYGNKLLLRVRFDSKARVISEELFETHRFTNNCIAIKGRDDFCFTISKEGYPAIWDRDEAKYIYYGRFVDVKINNPYKYRNYYDDDYFEDIFKF
jgi:hypothetical protein